MKRYLVVIMLLQIGLLHAQFGPQQVIDNESSTASSVYAADIDGDGNQDILSASTGDNTIAWFRNTDGMGSFGSKQVIALLDATDFVNAADLDGDGDTDVIGASFANDIIVWYENLDGLGSFDDAKTVTTAVDLPKDVLAVDLNGDGDLDLVSASRDDNKVAWYENLDGLGDFGPQQIITTSALSTVSIDSADLDNDGDIDILVTSGLERRLYWYENLDGLGNFGPGNIIIEDPLAGFFNSVFGVDIDGDTDIDVISVELVPGRVAWYENLDGLGTFGPLQTIDLSLNVPSIAYAFDVDNDGDNDVLSQSSPDMKIVWYENLDGLGSFGPQQIVTTEADGPRSIYASDFDDDGDLDLASASNADATIAWYENQTVLAVDENQVIKASIYPNPTGGVLNIASPRQIMKLELFDSLGQMLKNQNEELSSIDISSFSSGVYIVKIYYEDGFQTEKIVKR